MSTVTAKNRLHQTMTTVVQKLEAKEKLDQLDPADSTEKVPRLRQEDRASRRQSVHFAKLPTEIVEGMTDRPQYRGSAVLSLRIARQKFKQNKEVAPADLQVQLRKLRQSMRDDKQLVGLEESESHSQSQQPVDLEESGFVVVDEFLRNLQRGELTEHHTETGTGKDEPLETARRGLLDKLAQRFRKKAAAEEAGSEDKLPLIAKAPESKNIVHSNTGKSVVNSAWGIGQISKFLPSDITKSSAELNQVGLWPLSLIAFLCGTADSANSLVDLKTIKETYRTGQSEFADQCPVLAAQTLKLISLYQSRPVGPPAKPLRDDAASLEAWEQEVELWEKSVDDHDAAIAVLEMGRARDKLKLNLTVAGMKGVETSYCPVWEQHGADAVRAAHIQALEALEKYANAVATNADATTQKRLLEEFDSLDRKKPPLGREGGKDIWPKVALTYPAKKKSFHRMMDRVEHASREECNELYHQMKNADSEEARKELESRHATALQHLDEVIKIRDEFKDGFAPWKSHKDMPPQLTKHWRDIPDQTGGLVLQLLSMGNSAGTMGVKFSLEGAAQVAGIVGTGAAGAGISIVGLIPMLIGAYFDEMDSIKDRQKASIGKLNHLSEIFKVAHRMRLEGGSPVDFLTMPYMRVRFMLLFQTRQGFNQAINKHLKAMGVMTLGTTGVLSSAGTIIGFLAAGILTTAGVSMGIGAAGLAPVAIILAYYYASLGYRSFQKGEWAGADRKDQLTARQLVDAVGWSGLHAFYHKQQTPLLEAELRDRVLAAPKLSDDQKVRKAMEKRLATRRLADNYYVAIYYMELDLQQYSLTGQPGQDCDALAFLRERGFPEERIEELLAAYKSGKTLAEASEFVQNVLAKEVFAGVKFYELDERMGLKSTDKSPGKVAVAIEDLLQAHTQKKGDEVQDRIDNERALLDAEVLETVEKARLEGKSEQEIAVIKWDADQAANAALAAKSTQWTQEVRSIDDHLDELTRLTRHGFAHSRGKNREVLIEFLEATRKALWEQQGIGTKALQGLLDAQINGDSSMTGDAKVPVSKRVSPDLVELLLNPATLRPVPRASYPAAGSASGMPSFGPTEIKKVFKAIGKAERSGDIENKHLKRIADTRTNRASNLARALERLQDPKSKLRQKALDGVIAALPVARDGGYKVPAKFEGNMYAYLSEIFGEVALDASKGLELAELVDPGNPDNEKAIENIKSLRDISRLMKDYVETRPWFLVEKQPGKYYPWTDGELHLARNIETSSSKEGPPKQPRGSSKSDRDARNIPHPGIRRRPVSRRLSGYQKQDSVALMTKKGMKTRVDPSYGLPPGVKEDDIEQSMMVSPFKIRYTLFSRPGVTFKYNFATGEEPTEARDRDAPEEPTERTNEEPVRQAARPGRSMSNAGNLRRQSRRLSVYEVAALQAEQAEAGRGATTSFANVPEVRVEALPLSTLPVSTVEMTAQREDGSIVYTLFGQADKIYRYDPASGETFVRDRKPGIRTAAQGLSTTAASQSSDMPSGPALPETGASGLQTSRGLDWMRDEPADYQLTSDPGEHWQLHPVPKVKQEVSRAPKRPTSRIPPANRIRKGAKASSGTSSLTSPQKPVVQVQAKALPAESLARYADLPDVTLSAVSALRQLPPGKRRDVYALEVDPDRQEAHVWLQTDRDGVYRVLDLQTGRLRKVTPESQVRLTDIDIRQPILGPPQYVDVDRKPEEVAADIEELTLGASRPRPGFGELSLGELLETPEARDKAKRLEVLSRYIGDLDNVDWSTAKFANDHVEFAFKGSEQGNLLKLELEPDDIAKLVSSVEPETPRRIKKMPSSHRRDRRQSLAVPAPIIGVTQKAPADATTGGGESSGPPDKATLAPRSSRVAKKRKSLVKPVTPLQTEGPRDAALPMVSPRPGPNILLIGKLPKDDQPNVTEIIELDNGRIRYRTAGDGEGVYHIYNPHSTRTIHSKPLSTNLRQPLTGNRPASLAPLNTRDVRAGGPGTPVKPGRQVGFSGDASQKSGSTERKPMQRTQAQRTLSGDRSLRKSARMDLTRPAKSKDATASLLEKKKEGDDKS